MHATHTPGPWTLWGGTSRDGLPYFLIGPVDPRGGGVPQSGVATVDFVPAHADAMVRNARLIAAAPELLSALKAAVAVMTGWSYSHIADAGDTETVRICKAAIAKAEGRAE